MKAFGAALACTSVDGQKYEANTEMLSQQIQELTATLDTLAQHAGSMILNQRAKHQLVN